MQNYCDSLSGDLGSGGASSQSATGSTPIHGSCSDWRRPGKTSRDRGLKKDDAQENGPKRWRIPDEENVDYQSPKKRSHREAVTSSDSRSPLGSIRWELFHCDEENVQAGEDDLSGEDDEDDISAEEDLCVDEEELEKKLEYDIEVDGRLQDGVLADGEEVTSPTKESWMKETVVGKDLRQWLESKKQPLKNAKKKASDHSFVLDALVAFGGTDNDLSELAGTLSADSDSLSDFDSILVELSNIIQGTGLSFSTDGDIFSEIEIPGNAADIVKNLLSTDKSFRKKAGSLLNTIYGDDVSSLGQPIHKLVTHLIYQHWATRKHKGQKCMHNKIDESLCNKEWNYTTPTWLLCDKHESKYESGMPLPSHFNEQLCLRDDCPITIDKDVRVPNSTAKKPPTDVRGQMEAFADKANTTVCRLKLLPKLYAIMTALVSKLSGNHLHVLVGSVTVYKKSLDCAPPMTNGLFVLHGGVVHSQNIIAAAVQLRKYRDAHLNFLSKKILDFFAGPLQLQSDQKVDMLMIRSGRSKMNDEMKQLLRDECNPLLDWVKKATPEQLSARARKRAENMGPERLSEAARKAARKGHAKKDENGKSLAALKAASKRIKNMGPERLSEAARKGHAKKDENGKSLAALKAASKRIKNMGPERLSEAARKAARKGHAKKDENGKSLAALKAVKTKGPEGLRAAALKRHAKKDENGKSLAALKCGDTLRAKTQAKSKQKKEFRIRTVREVLDEVAAERQMKSDKQNK